MDESALRTLQDPTHPPRLADLDLVGVAPTVVDGHAFPRHGYVSPLANGTHCLTGGVVTDPDEIAAIHRRVQATAAGRGAWRRRLRMIRRYTR